MTKNNNQHKKGKTTTDDSHCRLKR